MKKLLLCFPVLVLLWGGTGAHGGTTTANQFIYKPHMGAGGVGEKALFEAGLDKVDAHLGKYKPWGIRDTKRCPPLWAPSAPIKLPWPSLPGRWP